MSAAPELSVVVPAHDVGLWLGELLSSVLEDQSLPEEPLDLEVIVVDDASGDDTREVAESYAARDPRVRVVSSPGRGGGEARNHGVSLARGEFLAFADGDDIVPRRAYAAMVRQARACGADMVVGRFFKFFSDRVWWPVHDWAAFDEPRTGVRVAEQPSLIRNRACWNRVFRRDFWTSQAITFPDATRSNDIVPMVRALLAARIDVVTDTVYAYRDRPGPGSMTARSRSAEGIVSYLRQELECARLVAAAGSPALAEEYASLVVAADGWTAIARALGGLGELDADVAEELEPAHDLAVRLLDTVGRDAVAAVLARARPHVRWGWHLVEARAWAPAAALGGGGKGWGSRPVEDVLDALDQVAAGGVVPAEEIAPDLAAALFERPVDAYPEPAAMAALVDKHRDLLATVAGLPGADDRVVRLVEALGSDRGRAESLLAAHGELVVAAGIEVRGGRVEARLDVVGRPEDVRVLLVGPTRTVAAKVRRDPARPDAVTAVVSASRLGPGTWRLRYETTGGAGPVAVPGRAVAASSRPGNGTRLAVVHVGGRSRHAVEAAPTRVRRAVGRARRALRSRLRR